MVDVGVVRPGRPWRLTRSQCIEKWAISLVPNACACRCVAIIWFTSKPSNSTAASTKEQIKLLLMSSPDAIPNCSRILAAMTWLDCVISAANALAIMLATKVGLKVCQPTIDKTWAGTPGPEQPSTIWSNTSKSGVWTREDKAAGIAPSEVNQFSTDRSEVKKLMGQESTFGDNRSP